MYADGARVFVEAGPGRVLTGLVGRILGKRPHAAIACDRPNERTASWRSCWRSGSSQCAGCRSRRQRAFVTTEHGMRAQDFLRRD